MLHKSGPDGMMAKCGGPGLCRQCNWDASHFRIRAPGASVGSRAASPTPLIGCICPPGANLTCARLDCPRKAVRA